ncbi:kinetochore-associated protein 1-like [Asterias amurensis]|uniref:kinetochore-associated protein 1-like n=1 Tax=Asterias amurensis TaxID=7602 RepID=UPI003AB419A0
MSWDDVEADIGGEETANFGPRQESGTSLFQVDTLATISPRGEVFHNPDVYATSAPEGFCVAAGCQVSLFDEVCQKFISTLSFESDVDVVAWSQDSLFLVVAERSGSIHFVDVELKQILFSKVLKSRTEMDNTKCFLQVVFSPSKIPAVHDLLILSSDGQLIRFSNINLEKLNEAIEARDLQLAKELQASIRMESVDTREVHTEGVCFFTTATCMKKNLIITCGYGEASVAVWSQTNKTTELVRQINTSFFDGRGVVKCRVSGDNRFLFLLDDSYTLSAWDLQSLLMVAFWPDVQVQDFLLVNVNSVNTSDKNSTSKSEQQAQFQLVVLTRPDPDCYLKVFTLPGFQCTYTLTVCGFSTLAEVLPNQETIFLIEGAYDDDEVPSEVISTLRVRCLTEALPETRFHRLLHKQKFEEAQNFAQLFKLDEELVFKVKAGTLLEKSSPWTVSLHQDPDAASLTTQLIECLDHIQDETFVTEKCIQATQPTFEEMFELVSYARKRLLKQISSEPATIETENQAVSKLMTRVLEVLHRLGTYQMVFGYQNFSGRHWDQFLHADMLQELLHWLSMGHIAKAVVVWRRHKANIESNFTSGGEEILESILTSIPESTPSAEIIPWLREDLIPFVIHRFPVGKKFLACWMEERARNMEISEKMSWPGNSLEFANLFFNASQHKSSSACGRQLATPAQFSTEVCNLSAGNSKKLTEDDLDEKEVINAEFDCTEAVCKLQDLIKHLKELLRLHTKYQCKLSLADYSQETTSTLVFRMLDRVAAPELIPGTITKLVQPYIQEHNLNGDKLLLHYIQDLLKSYAQGRSVTYVYEAFWEAKTIAIIHCIKDIECKCLAIYSLMISASMPWNDKMERLVHQGLSLKHPKVEELRGKYKLVQLKKMLAKYDLRHDNVRKDNAWMVIKNILVSDGCDCLEDALQVAKTYNHLSTIDVSIFRLRFLIQHDRIQDCIELLSSMNPSEAMECARRIVTWSEVLLNESTQNILDQEDKNEIILITKGIVSILKFLLSRITEPLEVRHLQDLQKDLKCMLSLQVEYDEFLPLEDFRTANIRKAVLTKHLTAFYLKKSVARDSNMDDKQKETMCQGEKKRKESPEKDFTKISSLARILGTSHEDLKCQLAIKAAQTGQIKTALKICKELSEYTCNPTISETIYRVTQTVCELWSTSHPSIMNNTTSGDEPSLSTELYQLSCKALTHCHQNMLCDCSELCKLVRLTDSVYHQCESGDYGISVQTLSSLETKRDPYVDWTFSHYFKEDTLVLTSSYALPTTCKFMMSCLPRARSTSLPLENNRMAGRTAVDLQDVLNPENLSQYLQHLTSASLELIQCLQENNQYEMAFHVLAETLATSLQYTAANTMGNVLPDNEEYQALIRKEQERCTQIAKMGNQKMREFTATLMDKVFGSRRVDHHLALSFACVLPKPSALEKLKSLTASAGHHYQKVLAIAKVGCELGRLHKEPMVEQMCQKLETDATWGHRLGKLKISFKEVFNAQDTQHKRMLLPQIVKHPETDINLIKNYCSAFKLEEDEALLMYLERLLLPPVAPSDIPPDVDQAKVLSIIREVGNKDSLAARLNTILDKVNSYDYIRLNFVLKCIKDENPGDQLADVGFQLMEYLAHYTRVTGPSEYEIMFNCTSDEQQLLGSSVPLSPLSKEKLPYHPLMKGGQWKILACELNEDTVHQLLPVAKLLKLPTDHLFVTTINNLMKRSGSDATPPDRPSGAGGDRLGSSMDKKSLEVVQSLLLSISSPEMAVATARVVVKELPMGPLKVMALEICVLLARLWKEKCPENSAEKQKAELTHQKLSHVCRCLATEQVLHKYQLEDPELLKLVDQPAKLTFKLYEHESIERRIVSMDDGGMPDIHEAAFAIAEVNNCNIQKIRLYLVEKWLPSTSSNKQAAEDTTVDLSSLSFLAPKEDKLAEEERSLARVKYLLQFNDFKGSALFLLNFAYKQASSKISNACRVRALRCLFSLLNTKLIEMVAEKPVDSIREFMQSLIFLMEFESLNTSMDLSVFTTSNKQGLVRGLWKHYNHEPRAVRLIADLCLDYSVHDPRLWNSVLQQLLKFGMLDYLRHVLVSLAEIPELWQLQCLPRVWKSVLLAPFTTVCPPLSEEQEEACRESAALLQRCPIIHDLDMMEPCRQFMKVEMYAFAVGCLMYITDTQHRDKQIETLLSGNRHLAILDEIASIQKQKKLLTAAERIKATVFHYIKQKGSYDTVLATPHFPELINYLVTEDSIEDLLRKTLIAKRFSDAARLVMVYYSHNPGSPSALATGSAPTSDMLQLRAYMEHHDMSDLIPALPQSHCNGDAMM